MRIRRLLVTLSHVAFHVVLAQLIHGTNHVHGNEYGNEPWKVLRFDYSTVRHDDSQRTADATHIHMGRNYSPIVFLRGGGGGGTNKQRSSSRTTNTLTLSLSEPFLSYEDIADMTLSDVTACFEYAVTHNRDGTTDERQVLSTTHSSSSLLRNKVFLAMDGATARSRGTNVPPSHTTQLRLASAKPKTTNDKGSSGNNGLLDLLPPGDVDALQFCAAMRIFAEWRLLRQVPDGFKGYANGMNLGHRDVVQNIAKIENAVHGWMDHQRDNDASGTPPPILLPQANGAAAVVVERDAPSWRSPTLRELLQYEIDSNLHPKLPRLKEKSAAMGLLWVRRQLAYQTQIFSKLLEIPETYANAGAAVAAAYTNVYDNYHGWAIQKIFHYSFQAAPQVEQIYSVMNSHFLKEVLKEATQQRVLRVPTEQEEEDPAEEKDISTIPAIHLDNNKAPVRTPPPLMETLQDLTNTMDDMDVRYTKQEGETTQSSIISSSSTNDNNSKEHFGKLIGEKWNKLSRMFRDKWDKLVSNTSQSQSKGDDLNVRGGGGTSSRSVIISLKGEALEAFIHKEMSEDAHRHIAYYLDKAQPLVKNLAVLFDELNMDDPTKV